MAFQNPRTQTLTFIMVSHFPRFAKARSEGRPSFVKFGLDLPASGDGAGKGAEHPVLVIKGREFLPQPRDPLLNLKQPATGLQIYWLLSAMRQVADIQDDISGD